MIVERGLPCPVFPKDWEKRLEVGVSPALLMMIKSGADVHFQSIAFQSLTFQTFNQSASKVLLRRCPEMTKCCVQLKLIRG